MVSTALHVFLGMGFWAKAFRFTAIFLVLFTGVEMLTCDFACSDCSVISSHDKQAPLAADGNSCICCCAHPVLKVQLAFVPVRTVSPAPPEEAVPDPISRASDIEHPPKLT
jgi:hypothetical protein